MKADLKQTLAPIRTDLTLLKWMMGAMLYAGVHQLQDPQQLSHPRQRQDDLNRSKRHK